MMLAALLFPTAILGVAFVGGLGAAVRLTQQQQRQAEADWFARRVQQAEQLGLAADSDGSFSGVRGNHGVLLQDHAELRECAVRLRVTLGPISIRRQPPHRGERAYETLPGIYFSGPDDLDGPILAHEGLRAHLSQFTRFRIADGVLRTYVRHGQLGYDDLLDRTLELTRRLEDAVEAPWIRLVNDLGLTRSSAHQAEGHVWGRDVRASVDDHFTRIEARFSPPMQGAIRKGEGGVDLRDPILDGHVAIDADAAERLGPIDDDLRATLMEIFAQYPASVATGDTVRIVVLGRAGRSLGHNLWLAAKLAEHLDGGAQ